MAKKSAASAKVMKPEFKDGKSTRDKFNEWKGVELFTMEVAIEQSRRIDTWVSMREDAKHFLERTPDISEVNALCMFETELLEKMYEDLKALEFATVADNDYEDIYAKYVIKPTDCKSLEDFFRAFLVYSTVKSWAQHVFDVHHTVMADGTNE